jgi:hypothetical protein
VTGFEYTHAEVIIFIKLNFQLKEWWQSKQLIKSMWGKLADFHSKKSACARMLNRQVCKVLCEKEKKRKKGLFDPGV